jgi:hypothetical protein
MKNRKMNIDRPPLESKEIQAGMNFGQLMIGYQAMSKPFYKTKWFFGTAGMASIGLIVGGTIALSGTDNPEQAMNQSSLSDAPPLTIVQDDHKEDLIAMNVPAQTEIQTDEKIESQTKKIKHDKNTTPVINSDQSSAVEPIALIVDQAANQSDENNEAGNETKKSFDPMDLTPRINGKMNGEITREDLMDNKGLTTNTDVSIIHFELHLIDGLGGKVFEEESNQLNQQMKTALGKVEQGETIYFENIRGKTSDGFIVRLNPLRYVLLN